MGGGSDGDLSVWEEEWLKSGGLIKRAGPFRLLHTLLKIWDSSWRQ